MTISPARIAAYEILIRIERDIAYSSVLLPQFEARLNEKDRALCHQIVLGVLRRKYFLDAVVAEFSGGRKIDIEVLTALRIGSFQILFLDRIPDHSAVNESVALVQRAKKSSAKGFVNAILRKVAKNPLSPDSSPVSIATSHPEWLLERWSKAFGEERAVSIAHANNEPPRLAFRLTKKGRRNNAGISDGAVDSDVAAGARVAERMTGELRSAAERGEVYFQDEASQLIANNVSIPSGGRFLDVCAAPGGKTTLIASRHDGSVVAGDLYQSRVELLRDNAINQGVSGIEVVRYDASESLPFADESFDTILLDAPCSGTGTIRSNPEIRYSIKPEDIRELSLKQLSILKNASKLLKIGGELYYSTCSLEPDENEGVISQFISFEGGSYRIVRTALDERFISEEGFARTFPDRDGTDGFFMAVIIRDR